jgi:hypothetical protein
VAISPVLVNDWIDNTADISRCAVLEVQMPYTWYVTFEVQKRGALPRRRSPRETRTFETEREAKNFARAKFNEGLILYSGTINPYSPRQAIPSSSIPSWLEHLQEQETADPDNAQEAEK